MSIGESWSLSEFWNLLPLLDTRSFHLLLVICFLLSSLCLSPPSSGGGSVRGRYSHVAAVMEGRVLLVAGGYSGVARGDLVAFKVPLFVSSDQGDRVSVKQHWGGGGGVSA